MRAFASCGHQSGSLLVPSGVKRWSPIGSSMWYQTSREYEQPRSMCEVSSSCWQTNWHIRVCSRFRRASLSAVHSLSRTAARRRFLAPGEPQSAISPRRRARTLSQRRRRHKCCGRSTAQPCPVARRYQESPRESTPATSQSRRNSAIAGTVGVPRISYTHACPCSALATLSLRPADLTCVNRLGARCTRGRPSSHGSNQKLMLRPSPRSHRSAAVPSLAASAETTTLMPPHGLPNIVFCSQSHRKRMAWFCRFRLRTPRPP